ncbi:MAG: hypothetical protein LBQ58_08470 [Synergistaceae bacterium]|jgi:hypothetical protein|nr:hypothetical protein [Synergistaceae bacterium]
MYYMKDRLERRGKGESRQTKAKGHRFTFFSFIAMALFLILFKAVNPQMQLRSILIPFGCVLLACLMMIFMARRKG